MTTVYMPIVVKKGQNIFHQVQRKFPNATLVDIVITNSQGNEFVLSDITTYISTIDRIVMYRMDLRGEVSISKGDNILDRVHEIFPGVEPEFILFQWPATNEWRPLAMISNYISSIDRLVRVTMEPVTSFSVSEPSSPNSSLGTIPRFREPGSYGFEFYSQKIRIREDGTPDDDEDQGTPIFNFNDGLTHASPNFLLSTFGQPDGDYVDGEQELFKAHPKLRGRFTGFSAAAEDLAQIFENIDRDYPDLLQYVSTVGMRTLRRNRNNRSVWSNHAWGTAVDLGMHPTTWFKNGVHTVDRQKNLVEYNGIILMAPYFRELQWYWGGEFSSLEDGMHFEVSRTRIETWQRSGRI